MLQEFSDLPKVIDAFVRGVVEFFYRFLLGVAKVSANPFVGSLRLYARESDLSSRTTLFLSCSLISLGYFVTLPGLRKVYEDQSVGLIIFKICTFYIIFDSVSFLGGRLSEQRKRRLPRAVAMMRYSFSTSIMLVFLIVMINQSLYLAHVIDLSSWINSNIITSFARGIASLIFVSFIFFYPPAVTFVGFHRRKRKPEIKRIILVGILLPCFMLSCALTLYYVPFAFRKFEDATEKPSKLVVRNLVCEQSGDLIDIHAAVENDSDDYVTLAPYSLSLRVALDHPRGMSSNESLAKESTVLRVDWIEGGVVAIKAREVIVLSASALLSEEEAAILAKSDDGGDCRLEADLLNSKLRFSSPAREIMVGRDDGLFNASGFRDMKGRAPLPAPPIYVPGKR